MVASDTSLESLGFFTPESAQALLQTGGGKGGLMKVLIVIFGLAFVVLGAFFLHKDRKEMSDRCSDAASILGPLKGQTLTDAEGEEVTVAEVSCPGQKNYIIGIVCMALGSLLMIPAIFIGKSVASSAYQEAQGYQAYRAGKRAPTTA